MKKIKWLLAMVLCLAMMVTGCGGATLEGKWSGKWYVGDFIAEGMGSSFEAYADSFDDVYIIVELEISEDEIEISIDKDSEDILKDSLESAMTDFVVTYMNDMAEEYGVDIEEFYGYMGYDDEDDMIEDFLASADIDTIAESLFEDIESETVEYKVDDDVLEIEYEDGEEDEWKFELDGNTLVIEMVVNELDVEIEFERQ